MKQFFFIFLLSILATNSQAQNSAEVLANKIATRLKDSLNLSDSMRLKLYDINMQLHNKKTIVRTQFMGSDSLHYKIQLIENTRDSLYSTIIPPSIFVIYKQKKRQLVRAY